MKFLDGLSEDSQKNLLKQLTVYWTHSSNAIEGNTLTIGETEFVISEGLTVNGKPLKDHMDAEGHARAVQLIMNLCTRDELTETDLFDIHRLVISDKIIDVYKPVGHWKNTHNSTTMFVNDKSMTINYSPEWETPELMVRWIELLNTSIRESETPDDACQAYSRLHVSFVSIHPFYDGNGRVARLISNMPCLKAGFPPIVIDNGRKYEYLQLLAEYQLANGVPGLKTSLVFEGKEFDEITAFFRENWQPTIDLVEATHKNQKEIDRVRQEQCHNKSFSRGAAEIAEKTP